MPISAEFLTALTDRFGRRFRQNEPLSAHVTSRLGGPADVWLPVKQLDELVQAVALARHYQVPVFILGSGANLLIKDTGLRGLIVENQVSWVQFPESQTMGQTVVLRTASGTVLPSLVRRCAQRGLSGLEWAVGVPGTIGGAVVNNAGAYGSDMASNLIQIELLSPDNSRLWRPVEWLDYDYRSSRLKRQPEANWVILQAELRLTVAPMEKIQARIDSFNERRKRSQPPGATMGSMFKNPPGDYAGRLIEAAGLKGYRVGQAQISPIHANFFQNLGGATAANMLELIQIVQKTVADQFETQLELEVEVVGE